jgi:cellulose synthase operon protein C
LIYLPRKSFTAIRFAWLLPLTPALFAIAPTAEAQTARTAARTTSEPTAEPPRSAAEAAAEVKDFEIACDKATQVASDLEAAQGELDYHQHHEKNPDRQKIAEIKADIDQKTEQAFALCQRAIELSDAKSNLEKLNLVRYMLCYFHYAKQNYYEAAVLGDFLARKYPDAEKARMSAQLALDALYRQIKQAGGGDTTFESGKLTDLANYMLKTWPDQPEAGMAADFLMQFDLADGNFDRAHETVARMPEGSRARADAELRLGHALWSKYLRSVQQLRQAKAGGDGTAAKGAENPKSNPELVALVKQAQESLESGFKGLQKYNEPTDREVLAVLSLAQLYVDQSQANKAVTVLEDAKLGPLALLKKNSAATHGEGLATEIQRIALLAYLGAQPQQLNKATASLEAWEQSSSGDVAAKARVTQMLVGIAYDLQQKADELRQQNDQEKLAPAAAALKTLLGRIADQSATADSNTLIWLAEAFEKLASAAAATEKTPADGKLPPEVEANNRQAIKLYEQILARAKSEPDFLPAEKSVPVRYHMAIVYRGLGDFDSATARLAEILKAKPTLLSVQIEAARTYQMRGAVDQTEYYIAAIQGGKGDTAPIWGWGKLANQTSKDAKFRDTFHEARYNIALCRQLHALSRPDSDSKKKKLLELAKDSIRETQQFESTMGGEKWKPKYDALLRELQKSLDQPAVGLYEFENKAAETPGADSKK